MDDTPGDGGLASGRTIGFMNGLDALFLYLESPETPMHVGSLHLFDVPDAARADFVERVRDHIAEHLDDADVFTRRLAPMPLGVANPAWVRAESIDLDHHVRRLRLPPPGTHARLMDLVASLHARLLDRDRPLWEMVVIEGLDSGRVAFYAKVHHAGLDGQAGVAVAQAVYDLAADVGARVSRKDAGAKARARVQRRPTPGLAKIAAAGVRHNLEQLVAFGRRLPVLARTLAAAVNTGDGSPGVRALLGDDGLLAPRTVLNGAISRQRAFATVSVPLARVRAIAERHEATVNDVVLAACGGALRAWLAAREELPESSLLAAVPVSLRARGDAQSNTQAMMARVTLATDRDDPIDRLHVIRDASRALKGAIAGFKSALPTEFPSLGLPWLGGLLATAWGRGRLADRLPPIANLVVSNVPGPPVPLYLEGARMLGFWPASIPIHGMALNVTVQSYAGSLDFGLIACRRRVPDVQALAQGIEDAIAALDQSPQPRAVGGAAPRRARSVPRKGAPGQATAVRGQAEPSKSPTRRRRTAAPAPEVPPDIAAEPAPAPAPRRARRAPDRTPAPAHRSRP